MKQLIKIISTIVLIFIWSFVIVLWLTPNCAKAEQQLYDQQTGKFLGSLSRNPYDPDSISNPYGRYGSKYSQDSINNPYGQYGSRYSPDSFNNPYAINPPVIINKYNGIYGR